MKTLLTLGEHKMLTFRSSKVVYYGPHSCQNCGQMIVKMGTEFGGNSFDQPQGPIYPNTEWYPHVCDPKRMKPSFIEVPVEKWDQTIKARNAQGERIEVLPDGTVRPI